MPERLDDFDEARHAGRGVEVTDVRLHRADPAAPLACGRLKRLFQRTELDGIAD